jgi:Cell wall-associated hydrolases (invasion-associated proteins)
VTKKIIGLFIFVFCFGLGVAQATEPIRFGDEGPEVKAVQEQLQAAGYEIEADGDFGLGTEAVVKAFQKDRGLDVDGIVGEITHKSLLGRPLPTSRTISTNRYRRLTQEALRHQGVPYYFGGTTPNGFDCSGFTRYVFAKVGVELPRMADSQYYDFPEVVDLEVGDLVFFETYEPGPSHVGIYLGNRQFINASSSRGVVVDSLDSNYWSARYLGARRAF